jgi:peptidoglycan/LPS O-acetylase OafA/YrhL
MPGSVSAARRGDDSTPRLPSLYPQEVQKERHFRPDIQGLRALAVLLVIVAHAGFSTFAGGFVGVDVFFVISGFLITSLRCARRHARAGSR